MVLSWWDHHAVWIFPSVYIVFLSNERGKIRGKLKVMSSSAHTRLFSPVVRRVVIPAALGATGLFVSATSAAGSVGFYLATFFTAAVWIITWLLVGNRSDFRGHFLRNTVRGVMLGVVLIAVFVLGAVVVRVIPGLAGPVEQLLANMSQGTVWITLATLVVNGIGEEMFFRGVVDTQFTQVMKPWVAMAWQIVLYIVVTAAMGVPLLFVAALLIGGVATMEKRATGSLISASIMHVTWGLGMAFLLPVLIH